MNSSGPWTLSCRPTDLCSVRMLLRTQSQVSLASRLVLTWIHWSNWTSALFVIQWLDQSPVLVFVCFLAWIPCWIIGLDLSKLGTLLASASSPIPIPKFQPGAVQPSYLLTGILSTTSLHLWRHPSVWLSKALRAVDPTSEALLR